MRSSSVAADGVVVGKRHSGTPSTPPLKKVPLTGHIEVKTELLLCSPSHITVPKPIV